MGRAFRDSCERALGGENLNPLRHTRGIAIELSNLCDWASIHKHCPLSLQDEVKILPTGLVTRVLRELGALDFAGYVAFHRYNEPLTDPRLYWLLKQREYIVPLATSYLCVNARYLDKRRLEELAGLGVSKIHLSFYGRYEPQIWLDALGIGLAVTTGGFPHMEDLLGAYEAPMLNLNRPCGAPLWEVVVTCEGDVGLCCRDWGNQHTFGSLTEATLSAILASDEVIDTYERLVAGDRFLDLCSRCRSARGGS